jgi:hypothetical protein
LHFKKVIQKAAWNRVRRISKKGTVREARGPPVENQVPEAKKESVSKPKMENQEC